MTEFKEKSAIAELMKENPIGMYTGALPIPYVAHDSPNKHQP